MHDLSTRELMAICESWWIWLATSGGGHSAEVSERHERYVLAHNELAERGPEVRDWARSLLSHPDYEARETGAFLLGRLGSRRLLGDAEEDIIAEVGALTRRPVEEDGKEVQAIDSAIRALGAIGDRLGIPYLRDVLFSKDPWLRWDTQWTAAEALGQLVGQSFMDTPDPEGSARAWLGAHPTD
jgi:HEAT repeat protein